MSRVRKDILNGWKEISGYVCRDIRTVERWEKYRGLPVRRVPGAGRATVYAIISEVDEWLASTPLTGPEALSAVPLEGVAPQMEGPGEIAGVGLSPEAQVMEAMAPEAVEPSAAEGGAAVDFQRPEGMAADADLAGRFTVAGERSSWQTFADRWLGLPLLGAAVIGLVLLALVWTGFRMPSDRAKSVIVAGEEAARPDARRLPHRSPVPGVDALYQSGMYSYEQRTPDSLQHSLERFSAAIAKDPSFAPAYVGLANTYNLLREYSRMTDAEAYPKAKEAAERAIALDASLPEAHASLAFVDFFWSWKAEEAEGEFRKALALDPSSALAHHWYGSMLTHEGRFAEAIEQLDAAQRLQPNSAAVLSSRALAWGLDGHRDEAVQQLNGMLSESSVANSPHAILAILSRVEPMDCEAYLRETRAVAKLRTNREVLQMTDAAERGFRSGGPKGMWTAMLKFERGLHAKEHPLTMVQAELALGDKEAALTDLETLESQHDPSMIGVLMEPGFRALHGTPRFVSLARRMGFPPELAQR